MKLLAKLEIKDAVIDTKYVIEPDQLSRSLKNARCAPSAPGDHSPEKLRESLQKSIAALAPHKVRPVRHSSVSY